MSIRKIASDACFTTIVGLPLALGAIVFGGRLLIWLLSSLPQG